VNGYLLDTHVLLWWLGSPNRLATHVREVIQDPRQDVFVSAAAAWEIGIKQALGRRLDVPDNLADEIANVGIETLPITFRHGLAVANLPPHHADPFDRLMIAQAQLEHLVLVTHDSKIHQYDVALLKA